MRLILSVVFIFISFLSFAHKDTGLKILDNGKLIGLPNKYEPASFITKSFELEVSGNKLIIPECVKRRVGITNTVDYTLDFSASWYHRSTTLPPYLNITVYPLNGEFNYYLMFNLDKLQLIKAIKTHKPSNVIGFRHTRETINYTPECIASIKIAMV
jgi:hypothetical protein